jgi:acyl transferase domain-containing protein
LIKEKENIYIEIGPGYGLSTLIKMQLTSTLHNKCIPTVQSAKQKEHSQYMLYEAIGLLWSNGIDIDWNKISDNVDSCRIPLPCYPFERKRCYVEPQFSVENTAAEESDIKLELKDWFYVPEWKKTSLSTIHEIKQDNYWLIFKNKNSSFQKEFEKQLLDSGVNCIFIQAGETYNDNNLIYTINPSNEKDYIALIASLKSRNSIPHHIVYMWPLNGDNKFFAGYDCLKPIDISFFGLLYLAKAISANSIKENVSINVISQGIHSVTGSENLQPETASLLGPCKVLHHEIPSTVWRNIDIDTSDDTNYNITNAALLIKEILSEDKNTVVAYRGLSKWVQHYERTVLIDASKQNIPIRKNGVYILTGGLGGLGLETAKFLSEEYKTKLLLITRNEFPDKKDWKTISENNEHKFSSVVKKMIAIENAGGEVIVFIGDLTDNKTLRNAISVANSAWGKVNGIFHMAGIAGSGISQLKTKQDAENVIYTKIKVLKNIENIIQYTDIEVLVLYSSTFAIIGGAGQIDYSAANNVLDTFAWYFTKKYGVKTISINWDAWAKVGMAARLHFGTSEEKTQKDDETHYSFNCTNNWVLNEHLIDGRPSLPGTSFFSL